MIHWLLTLRLGGRVFRLTSAPEALEVADSLTGNTWRFEPGLSAPTPTQALESFDGVEIPVEALLPLAAWEYIADAPDLSDATAELAQHAPGDDWAVRIIWADGRVDSPVYETQGDPVSFSVIETPWEDRSLLPSLTEQVSAATWPVTSATLLPEGAIGLYYPYIFGAPGVIYATDAVTEQHGWPAILVEIDETTLDNFTGTPVNAKVLLAGHILTATSVILYNRTTGLSALVDVETSQDLLGQTVSIASIDGATLQITEGDELWASCQAISDGGLAGDDGTVARGVGQIAALLLRRSTLRVDLSRQSELQRLDVFRADFFVNEPTSSWAIINDTLLVDGLPAFWSRSGRGYSLAVRPFEAALLASPILHIDPANLGGDRDGTVSVTSGAQVTTDMTVRFGQDLALNLYQRSITLAPVPTPGAIVHPLLASAYARTQVRRLSELVIDGYQDPATAQLLLALALRGRTRTIRRVRYQLPYNPRYTPGMIARITDDEIRWSERLCYLTVVSGTSEDGWQSIEVEEVVLEGL